MGKMMGGSALKNIITRRYLADEYKVIAQTITERLDDIFPLCRLSVIKAYHSKESFGDIDIIIDSEHLPSNYIDLIKQEFKSQELIKNGNCISFNIEQLQVDLIVTKPEEYETSKSYYSYNDLSNLCGRLANSMSLKLGHDGLSYTWKIDTYQFKNLVLLTDWNDILPVLGYDPLVYKQGFNTLEDIFKYASSSPFFNKAIFQLENRNHAARIRDKKRKTYTEFLIWLETQDNLPDYPKKSDKKEWLPYLFEKINGFEGTYHKVQKEFDETILYKSKFNGDIIREYTGLDGNALGVFMKFIKDRNPDRELFKEIILSKTEKEIEIYIKDMYNFTNWNQPRVISIDNANNEDFSFKMLYDTKTGKAVNFLEYKDDEWKEIK